MAISQRPSIKNNRMTYDPVSQILGIESGGNPNARNPNSSATGAGQFIDSTWLAMLPKYRPDLVEGKSPAEILALRSDPNLSRDMTAAYAAANGKILAQAGQEASPGNTYLAHFAGPQGAVKVLGAAPDAPVSSILGMEAVKANPFLANMTAADLKNWASRKMGGPQPQNTPQQAARGAPVPALSNPMLGVGAPPNNAPTASPQPQFSGGGGSIPAQMAAPAEMAPMQMLGAQMKPRDTYQRLAALFQRRA